MKHLQFLLLAALALPTAVLSGDLGLADFEKTKLKGKGFHEYPEQRVFKYNCGIAMAPMKKCVVDFSDGILSVDDSVGIKPSQIRHISVHRAEPIISIIYKDSNGKLVSAGFAHLDEREAFTFGKAFMKWINSEN